MRAFLALQVPFCKYVRSSCAEIEFYSKFTNIKILYVAGEYAPPQ